MPSYLPYTGDYKLHVLTQTLALYQLNIYVCVCVCVRLSVYTKLSYQSMSITGCLLFCLCF